MSALVSAQDRGLLLGDGVFDTMAVYHGTPQLREAHIARLIRHAAEIHIPEDPALIYTAMLKCLEEWTGQDCILRTTVTRGITPRGLWPGQIVTPTIICQATPFDRSIIGAPASLVVSSIARNQTSPASRIKSLAYLDHVLAAREAHEAGADDAVFLNTHGAITCTTIGNVFVLEGGTLTTPPLHDGVLDGIIRAFLLDHPPQGLRVVEQTITLDRAMKADAILITNSVRLVRPVTKLKDRIFAPAVVHQSVLSHVQRLIAVISTAQNSDRQTL
jgi:branched-chain amino acid aminotransferase